MKTLRPYQSAAVNAIWNWIYNESGYPFVSAAVNAGKSLIIAEFIRQAHTRWPWLKTVMLIDEQQLLSQNMDELRSQFPEVDAGFYSAGIGEKRLHNSVTIASIQSIYKKAHLFPKAPSLIIIDEGHGVSTNKDTQFRKFVTDCEKLNPKLKVVGLSGSKYRLDSGLVYGGKSNLFSGLAYEIGVKFMIEEGYSVRPVMPSPELIIDDSKVKVSGGEFVQRELQAVFDIDELVKKCVDITIRVGTAENRKQWLVYTTGVEHCEHVYEEFLRHGISACRSHSKINGDSKEVFADYKAGKYQCLVVVGQAVKGFSHNGIELIAYMMSTKSPVKYEQTVGRGMRTNYAEGMPLDTKDQRLAAIAASRKPNFTLLDFGSTVKELGPVDNIYIKPKTKREKKEEDDEEVKPALKYCPKCSAECAAAQRYCFECGHEFVYAISHSDKADMHSAVMSSDVQPQKLAVLDWTLKKHKRKRRKDEPEDKVILPVLRVTYKTYAGEINEWVCFNHSGLPRQKSEKWFDQHCHQEDKGGAAFLGKVFDVTYALKFHENNARPFVMPKFVYAKKSGKYWELCSKRFE